MLGLVRRAFTKPALEGVVPSLGLRATQEYFVGRWTGGKPGGNIQLNGKTYYVRVKGATLEKVRIPNFESTDKAFAFAKKVLREYCVSHKLVRNQYRLKKDERGAFVEVSIGKTWFTCDYENLDLVEKYLWNFNKKEGTVYAQVGPEKDFYFHRLLFDLDVGFKIEHADGDKLNNRRYNLICKKQKFKPKTN